MRYFKKGDVIRAFNNDVIVENFGIDETWIELLGDDVLMLETQKPSEFHTKWDSKNKTWLDGRTPEQLAEFNRKNMPNLSKRDFRKKLRDAKLFDLVDEYVKNSNDGYLQDAWDYSDYYSRTDPILIQALSDLGITPEKVDEIWTQP